MSMIPLKELLPKAIRKARIENQVRASLVLEKFKEVANELFEPAIAQKIKPLHLKNKIITVACHDSVLANEVKLYEDRIISQINEDFGVKMVERLRYIL